MHAHLCNENKFAGKPIGHWIWSARWWFHITRKVEFHTQWSLLHKVKGTPSLSIEWGHGDGDDGIMLHVCIPWIISIFTALDGILPRRWVKYSNGFDLPRETAIKFHSGCLSVSIFAKVMSWSRSDSWYSRSYTFHVSDWILGKPQYEETDFTGWSFIAIPMPEKAYLGKVRFFTSVWKRRFSTKRIRRCEVNMDEPVPFPGKGENSWDCGEDATRGLTAPHGEIYEAVAAMVEHVMRQRCRYGNGTNWRPATVVK